MVNAGIVIDYDKYDKYGNYYINHNVWIISDYKFKKVFYGYLLTIIVITMIPNFGL